MIVFKAIVPFFIATKCSAILGLTNKKKGVFHVGTPLNTEDATNKLDTVEVYVPGAKETRVNYLQFTPLVVALITLLNMVYTSITGKSLLGISDDELASYINLLISAIAIGVTAYKNLNITKGGRARAEVAKQAIPDKKKYKQQNK